jgi:formamidopyrimidine-DNA glycosylase
MLELPEASVIAKQADEALKGKNITQILVNRAPHKFAFFNGDPNDYAKILVGKTIDKVVNHAGLVEFELGDTRLLFGDGCNIRYYQDPTHAPAKEQLRLDFDDASCLVITIAMYGQLWAFKQGENTNPYYLVTLEKPSPYEPGFTYEYFQSVVKASSEKLSMKAFLATEQRFPGLGNGVLQDILYHALLHPKTKLKSCTEDELINLYTTIITILEQMRDQGGRDIEKDLYGQSGKYQTRCSNLSVNQPCPKCQALIQKEAYMGGSVYFCPGCQIQKS